MTIQASAMHSRNPAVPTARCWAGKGNVILDCPNQFIALFVEKLVIKDNIGTIHFKVPSLGEGPYRPQSLLRSENTLARSQTVNGGGMLGHWGGVKLYHLVCKASKNVRANC